MPKSSLNPQRIFILAVCFLFTGLAFIPKSNADITAQVSNGDSLDLIGIGMHQELRNDIYIGALFAPSSVTEVEQLRNDNIAKRMSIHFISAFSHRKMARHWKERLAMNNSRNKWQPLTREIVNFSRIFKRNFEVSDELNIDHVPGVGTQIYLNGTLFETIDKPGFADLLLNVWIGNNPPTKAFRKSIRGQDTQTEKDTLIAKFSTLSPIMGRFDADLTTPTRVASTTTESTNSPTSTADSVEQTVITPPQQAIVAETQTTPAPAPAEDNTQTSTSSEEPETTEVAKLETDPATAITDASPVDDSGTNSQTEEDIVQNNPLDSSSEINLDNELVVDIPAELEKTASLEAATDDDSFFDADLITGSYTRDLLGFIRQHQEYPKKALLRKIEGDVLAKVTINNIGEVIDVEIVEKSGSRILDKAVTKMVKKAAPFEAIPKELALQEFSFNVPISFQL